MKELKLNSNMIGDNDVVSSIEEVIKTYPQSKRFMNRFWNRCVVLKDINKPSFNVYLFSDERKYSIVISDTYCGCIMSRRKEDIMEHWHRGSDLADGKNIESTYDSIIYDIVQCEIEHIGEVIDNRPNEHKMADEVTVCLGNVK